MKTKTPIEETKTETLGCCWKTADQIAKIYGHSRPWVYDIADRFKIRTVSLAEPGKTGARLFDADQLRQLLDTLAEAQKDQPRVNPRVKASVQT
jgi:transposase